MQLFCFLFGTDELHPPKATPIPRVTKNVYLGSPTTERTLQQALDFQAKKNLLKIFEMKHSHIQCLLLLIIIYVKFIIFRIGSFLAR